MGNSPSTTKSTSKKSRRSSSNRESKKQSQSNAAGDVAARAQHMVGDIREGIQSGIKRLEEQDHPAAHFLDTMCGGYLDQTDRDRKYRGNESFYSEDVSEDDSRTVSEDETTMTDYRRRRDEDTASFLESDYEEATQISEPPAKEAKKKSAPAKESATSTNASSTKRSSEADTTKAGVVTQVEEISNLSLGKPLASSFAKRCYFTKSGIGKTTQHYEGLTLTGNVVLMLASAMKLKGCPTICDEDLRRVEQTYPNQFSRLPDELLLSSGWRRISKYCHFSNKPVPDGVPFFHSKQRMHPTGGYYFLLAAAVGMVRPIDVEPLTRDTLVLLETDYPSACDTTPKLLIQDPSEWTLVDKFCFFSGGPINTDEDVYYQADFDGNPIYMLAFLSPSLTPDELYKLDTPDDELALKSSAAVREVESVYDLTERDFDDLRLYHLGPCRALPQYILLPQAWTKVLPPHFLAARDQAFARAKLYEQRHGVASPQTNAAAMIPPNMHMTALQPYHPGTPLGQNENMGGHTHVMNQSEPNYFKPPALNGGFVSPHGQFRNTGAPSVSESAYYSHTGSRFSEPMVGTPINDHPHQQMSAGMKNDLYMPPDPGDFSYDTTAPEDEAIASHRVPVPYNNGIVSKAVPARLDPPEGEPPSLSKRGMDPSMFHYNDHDEVEDDNVGDDDDILQDNQESSIDANNRSFDHTGISPRFEESPQRSVDHASQLDVSVNEPQMSVSYDDEPQDEQYFNMPHGNHSYSQSVGGTDMLSPNESTDSGSFERQHQFSHMQLHQHQPHHYQHQHHEIPSPATESSPEPSPRGTEISQSQSSVMRGAQEYIRRSRQRRMDIHKQKGAQPVSSPISQPFSPDSVSDGEWNSPIKQQRNDMHKQKEIHIQESRKSQPKSPDTLSDSDWAMSPQTDMESEATWDSSSEFASTVSGGSLWTDHSNNNDRSSRRALILQMAKARMKNNSKHDTIREESEYDEEKKLDFRETATDIDLTQDLD